ncbi:hypothetical protein LINPERHAP1_LOCUS19419, partial [Linum perenne]
NLSAEAFTLPTQDHSFAKKYPALHASAEYARQLKATIGQLQVPPVLEHVPSSVDISSKSKLALNSFIMYFAPCHLKVFPSHTNCSNLLG